jgi:hypothetical protein
MPINAAPPRNGRLSAGKNPGRVRLITPDHPPAPRIVDRVSAGELLLWGETEIRGFGGGFVGMVGMMMKTTTINERRTTMGSGVCIYTGI